MKKLLALVLALVMTLGLATVGTCAAEYSDAADVSLNEAVDVMSAVGVFQGSDGKFSPKENLTREQAAKLIAYLDLGENTAETLPAIKVFDDVAADRWSAKYIAYCQDAGYVAGVGNGKFDPTGELTGYAFGKMLLCVLGYDADLEGFTGSNWSLNVATKMGAAGIGDTIEKAGSAVLTREEAAQYCLDTLTSAMVGYANKGTNVTMSDGSSVTIGASNAAAQTWVGGEGSNYTTGGNSGAGQTKELCEKLYGKKLVLTTNAKDTAGHIADKWTYNGKEVGTYATEADKTFVVTSTTGTLATLVGQLANQNGNYTVGQASDTTPTAVTSRTDANAFAVNDTTDDKARYDFNGTPSAVITAPKLGDQVELYVSDTNAAQITNVVVLRYTLAEISNISTSVSSTDKADGVTAYITLKDATGVQIGVIKNTKLSGYNAETYVKGAFIAAAVNAAKTEVFDSYVVTAAAEGKVSANSGSAITLAGTSYKKTGDYRTEYTTNDYTGTYAVYTDKNGYALGVTVVETGKAASEAKFVVSLYNVSGSDSYGVKSTKSYAQVIKMDGTVENLPIGYTTSAGKIVGLIASSTTQAYGYTAVASPVANNAAANGKYYVDVDGGISVSGAADWGTIKDDLTGADPDVNTPFWTRDGAATTIAQGFYTSTYDSNDEIYTLTTYSNSSYYTDTAAAVTTVASTAKSIAGAARTNYITGDTTFLVAKNTLDNLKVTVKTGTGNTFDFTGATGGNAPAYIISSKNGTAYEAQYVVFATDDFSTGASSDVLYLKSAGSSNAVDGGYLYTMYQKDGSKKEDIINASNALTKGYYETSSVSDKGVYVLSGATATTAKATVNLGGSDRIFDKSVTTYHGAYNDAAFVSYYPSNNALSIYNGANVYSDIPVTADTVVVDLHETDDTEYHWNSTNGDYSTNPGRVTYPGATDTLDAIASAAASGYDVTIDAYITADGVQTIFVTDVSRNALVVSASATTDADKSITAIGNAVITNTDNTAGTVAIAVTGENNGADVVTITISTISGTLEATSITATYTTSWAYSSTSDTTDNVVDLVDPYGNTIAYTFTCS